MQVIAMVSQKGGVGKTTLAAQLAVEAGAAGVEVALVDLDPQGSLTGWWNRREHAAKPSMEPTTVAKLARHLEVARGVGVKLMIIDTPGRNSPTMASVLPLVDLVVVPVRPSPLDLEASIATLDVVEASGKPMVFVVNGATSGTTIAVDIRKALGGLGLVAPTTVHARDDYVRPFMVGKTAREIRAGGKAALEIKELWAYINGRLRKQVRK